MMKLTFAYCLLTATLVSCCNPSEQKPSPIEFTPFNWLLGEWQRVEIDSTSTTFETWVKEGGNYRGHGYVMQGTDTVWQEHMVLQAKSQGWEFVVSTPGNADAVIFTLIESDSTSFVVTNLQHDFPKRIDYSRKGTELHALVTGGDTKLTYQFVLINSSAY